MTDLTKVLEAIDEVLGRRSLEGRRYFLETLITEISFRIDGVNDDIKTQAEAEKINDN